MITVMRAWAFNALNTLKDASHSLLDLFLAKHLICLQVELKKTTEMLEVFKRKTKLLMLVLKDLFHFIEGFIRLNNRYDMVM